MTVYRRLARSKKGMSTIFGGLFFVIIILMGFNVMLWGFIQYDAYNHVITSMSQRDYQAASATLGPVNSTYPPGGRLSCHQRFDIHIEHEHHDLFNCPAEQPPSSSSISHLLH